MRRPCYPTLCPRLRTRFCSALLALLAFSLAGCGTVQEHRARHQRTAWQALSEEDRRLVGEGSIRTGLGREAVYIALGRPNWTMPGAAGEEVWLFAGAADPIDPDGFVPGSEVSWEVAGETRVLEIVLRDDEVLGWKLRPVQDSDSYWLMRPEAESFNYPRKR